MGAAAAEEDNGVTDAQFVEVVLTEFLVALVVEQFQQP